MTLFVDLKRRDAALIQEEIFSSPEFTGWVEGHITGYFTSPGWRDDDSRKTAGMSSKTYEEVVSILTAERTRLQATTSKRVEVFVLDARM